MTGTTSSLFHNILKYSSEKNSLKEEIDVRIPHHQLIYCNVKIKITSIMLTALLISVSKLRYLF